MKIPATIGACADLLFRMKERRQGVQRQLEEMEEEERALKAHIIQTLPKSQASGVAGRLASVSVRNKEIPQVKDWEKFYAYVRKHSRFDLMQRRLAEKAVAEMLDDGVKVPGVVVFVTPVVSMSKL